ncbi:MAG: hypothetical protein WA931_02025 [Rhodococcus sp. (in: high G+C Gram-positive bacteria)]
MATPSTVLEAPRRAHTYAYYFDALFGCTVVATTPTYRPDLWETFLAGAARNYHHHDVTSALEYDVIRNGVSTSLFFCALDSAGRMLAGARVQGPYTDAGDTHADIEWRTHTGARNVLRAMVNERLHDGVVELKTGWVDTTAPRGYGLADMIGYAGPLGCLLLGARHALVTAADHVVGMWQRSGAVVADDVDPVSYPDHRYRTRALWWDLETVDATADHTHLRRMAEAARQLAGTTVGSGEPHDDGRPARRAADTDSATS